MPVGRVKACRGNLSDIGNIEREPCEQDEQR